ncbi:ribonucleoside-diphosphate reductase alpha chain [Saccharopolyspora lacisalsi]|uniref:ribonucleoside-diphosphate reductase n=1 Tax=Halosaccharopolyspora lacisalsi TaxID=1000566 RepID=A0A839E1U5_9PSEU|nr:vitamin B12-dependent ribonucleotide reductase [Halosaccharopolyspora lacisalsi]MBA8827814.1 ribonucleoside-diphosphate reductase alpha chain [Halosaccharopolyspora lacisalsi]
MPQDVTDAAPVTPTRSRRRLPRVRSGYRLDVDIGGTEFGMTVNVDGDQRLGAVFLDHSKHGSFTHGLVATISELLSTALAYGMPVDEFVERFLHTRFDPCGLTSDPDIRWAASPMDYLARRIGKDFLPRQRQITLGITDANTAAVTA